MLCLCEEKLPDAALQLPQRVTVRVRRVCFDEIGTQAGNQQYREDRDRDKRTAPAELADEQSADRRCDDGRDREYHRHQRHQARRILAAADVSHDGARQDDRGRAPHALHEPGRKHDLDTLCERGDGRRDGEQAHADVQHGQTSEAIGEQSCRNLSECHAEHENADDHLAAGQVRTQRTDHLRDRGQAEVYRQRRYGRQESERDD